MHGGYTTRVNRVKETYLHGDDIREFNGQFDGIYRIHGNHGVYRIFRILRVYGIYWPGRRDGVYRLHGSLVALV